MGIINSCLDIISLNSKIEEITEYQTNGNKIVTKRANPYVSGLTIFSVTIVLLCYMDDGKGTLSAIFGKKIIEKSTQ